MRHLVFCHDMPIRVATPLDTPEKQRDMLLACKLSAYPEKMRNGFLQRILERLEFRLSQPEADRILELSKSVPSGTLSPF